MSCANDSKVLLIDTAMDDAFGPHAGKDVAPHPTRSTSVTFSDAAGTRRV